MFPLLAAASAATLEIPADYPRIGVALNVASDGDTIELAAGEYTEDLSITKDIELVAPDGATIVGHHSVDKAEVFISGITFTGTNAYASSGISADKSVLEIEDCAFVDNSTTYGDTGALYAKDSDLSITDTSFERNRGYNLAGGIYIEKGDLALERVSFREDGSTYGHSAVYAKDAEVELRDCSFSDHQAYLGAGAVTVEGSGGLHAEGLVFERTGTTYGTGGGLYFKGKSATLLDLNFQEAQGYSSGGAVYLEAEEVLVEGLRVHTASCVYGSGGGLFVKADLAELDGLWIEDVECDSAGGLYLEVQELELTRSVVLNGTATYGSGTAWMGGEELYVLNNDFLEGGQLDLKAGGRGLFQNNIVSSSEVSFEGIDQLGWNAWSGLSPEAGEGDIEGDCDFVSYPDDLHLAEGSPCIDAGNPELLDEDGSRSDIGAFGPYPSEPVDTGDSGDTGGDGDSVGELPDDTGPSVGDSQDPGPAGQGLDDEQVQLEPFCGCGSSGSGAWILMGLGALLLRRRRA